MGNVAPIKRIALADLKPKRIESPWTILLYGRPGVGKTTFAAKMPDPIFLCVESQGADELEVARHPGPFDTFDDLRDALRQLQEEPHDFKTVAIDTLDRVERLIWDSVCKRSGVSDIEEVGGGFQKGYKAALHEWYQLISDLERLTTKRGMHVVLIAHDKRRKAKNPQGEDYEKWAPNLEPWASDTVTHWVKNLFFAESEIAAKKLNKKDQVAKGFSLGTRVIHTIDNAAFEAKNRHNLPDKIPLDFEAFVEAMANGKSATALQLMISLKLEEIGDAALSGKVKKAVEKDRDDVLALARIVERLNQIQEQGEKANG